MFIACQYGHADIVKVLRDTGDNVKQENIIGTTGL
jgi:ankyrin repeat protein